MSKYISVNFSNILKIFLILTFLITIPATVNAQFSLATIAETSSQKNFLAYFGTDCNNVGWVPFNEATVPTQGGFVQFFNTPRNCEFDYEPDFGVVTGYSQEDNYLVEVQVGENTSGVPRTGRLYYDDGGIAFTVNQRNDSCTYSLVEEEITILSTETTGSLTLNTQPGCSWKAYSLYDEVTINGLSTYDVLEGTGTATVNFEITDNYTSPRSFTILFGAQRFVINQVEAICNFSVPVDNIFVPIGGGTYTVDVSVNRDCEFGYFQNNPAVEWLTVIDEDIPGDFVRLIFTVDPNPNAERREKRVTVFNTSDFTFDAIIVSQDGINEAARVKYDFLGTNELGADLAVFRPSSGIWFLEYYDRAFAYPFGTGN